MTRSLLAVVALALGATAAGGHFVFVIPAADGAKAQVVFSDELAPDKNVPITKIASTKLHARGADKKATALTLQKGENAYDVKLPGSGTRIVYGMTDYGVLQKGKEKPYLLRYHPKAIVGAVPADGGAMAEAALEIVPSVNGGKVSFRVMAKGKPVADAEVNVMLPKGENKKLKADAKGNTDAIEATGQVGAWARHTDKAGGKHDGKHYDEARHYATLVIDVPAAK